MKRIPTWLLAALLPSATALAGVQEPAGMGPYNAEFLQGGDGLVKRPAPPTSPVAAPIAATAWTLHLWVRPSLSGDELVTLARLGEPGLGLALALNAGRPVLTTGGDAVRGGAAIRPGALRHLAAVADGGTVRLYLDGRPVASGRGTVGAVAPVLALAPREGVNAPHFAGQLLGATAMPRALSAREVAALAADRPDPELVYFEQASPTWPVQVRQQPGQIVPQDASTLPRPRVALSKPVAKPFAPTPALAAVAPARWSMGAWRMAEAPGVKAAGAALSRPGFDASAWHAATVPGTVLTTLVDRGVYPDPDYGLDNLAIPERLAHQDYWYRTEFDAPDLGGARPHLVLNGVNYAAEVWLNGERLGEVRGAFARGRFDLSGRLRARNALAVRVSPPPHPGGPHEESLRSGAGENGGMMALDGPTFIAAEGWDWMPTVRDRNTGLWQGVELEAHGPVRIADPYVTTVLPRPDNNTALLTVTAPLANDTGAPVAGTLVAEVASATIRRAVTVPPGGLTVKLTPSDNPGLTVRDPQLWWPNGYGEPRLHPARFRFEVAGAPASETAIRFGMREVTYDLSLFDAEGRLRRVRAALARAPGERLIDVSHEGIRKVAGELWAASLTPAGEKSPAIERLAPSPIAPHLVIRVNGVPIAVRGGNWGMDDWRKRVGEERLRPYFRLHREANFNTIRNWMGQNTEAAFYELADEHGLMVVNDFWASTQDHQIEPQDVPLFMANATDTVRRFRHHPSIVLWLGRNEGVPQPILNEALDTIIRAEDGTRHYNGQSRHVNMAMSGPWHYQPAETYFTEHARGFSTEIGTPSFPTLEGFEAMMPAAERWPMSDAWAYHDWHQDRGGDTRPFVAALEKRFGPARDLPDFERKAQMLNYESHRAIFEGMNARLFTANSARLLWMSQPAWPSTVWQAHGHDYDTHASHYGARKGAEPVHVQLNLPTDEVAVVNSLPAPLAGEVRVRVLSLGGATLHDERAPVRAAATATTVAAKPPLAALLEREGAVLVALDLHGADGRLLSENRYWRTRSDADGAKLAAMPAVALAARATVAAGTEPATEVALENRSSTPALMTKLTLVDAAGRRVLPAYYSDNYVTLLPGETRRVTIRHGSTAAGPLRVRLRGWNVAPGEASGD